MKSTVVVVLALLLSVLFVNISSVQITAAAQGPQADESAKTGAPGNADPPPSQPHPEDRPWIIKQRPSQEPGASPAVPKTHDWKGETQKHQCEARLGKLEDSFLNARYSSIQGDSCTTARQAGIFMDLVEECRRECPEGFLEYNGYTGEIVRNLEWLERLGTERCVGTSR